MQVDAESPEKKKKQRQFYDEPEKKTTSRFELHTSDSFNLETCINGSTAGTVFDLIPDSNKSKMYPHQLEGFEFL